MLGKLRLAGVADATGAANVPLENNEAPGIREALAIAAEGRPVIGGVNVDYSKRTRFTTGVVQTVLKRFPMSDRVRFVGRALWRKVRG